MNKSGFTLIELLAVIALLAIVALVAIPAVDSALKESRGKLSKTQEKQIINGAKDFFAENIYCLPGGNSSKCSVNNCSTFSQTSSFTQIGISCLQDLGYLPANVVDFNKDDDDVSGRNYSLNTVVKVTKSGSGYSYQVTEASL